MRAASMLAGVLLVAVLSAAGCAGRLPVLDYDSLEPSPDPDVVDLWESHRAVIVRVLRDKDFTLREFAAALRFFERVTGLPGNQDESRYGPVPNEDLPRALESWDDWFRTNGATLRTENLR